ncbi:MAG: SRPBCC family protein [Pseudonocardia sp.]|nr:SRPBCC family protein [Pseudonocardia sp.]
MAEISVTALAMIDAPADDVRAALADYREIRPTILTSQFSGYEVVKGGVGAGSQVRWTLNPGRWGRRQAREWLVDVEEPDGTLVEHDRRLSSVTTWAVIAAPDGRSVVRVELRLDGPNGIRGMLTRSRAGKLRRVYGEVLFKLRKRFVSTEPGHD